ncbi:MULTISPECIES: class III extradiol ring-cleavage dioxygenase [unclassified Halomonas]|uniref:DODA-type extradiol aromatic ring-opening family dioxygenase n=1 Tax=unclassified Halomonas TaxID=2609666 RepID=UPI0007D9C899|nr:MULTISPECIES: class III extradiol ring-cleavage dioxygenase [unclassified Halomonas]MBT2785797.1 dioxygenase [Halomonas sp. ISL-106]MBT2798851.1 dioxygenase [Halomonas sp. ISL-104]OAL59211.1 dioxygenase [Halomonas sp. ALS9]
MLPSLFISHGSPMLALNKTPAHAFLRELGKQLSPKAIVVVSAHWESLALKVSISAKPETIHDFGGFPRALFECQYPALGAPELAERLAVSLGAERVERGLDHGAWVPLSLMFPDATVPVVSLSLPVRWSNAELITLGERLSALREEEILVIGSGSLTHNLYEIMPQDSPMPAWVDEFATWVSDRLVANDREALLSWERAPNALKNHPTPEHFQPLMVAMGAGGEARQLHHSVEHGVLAMDVYQFA